MYNRSNALINENEKKLLENKSNIFLFSINKKDGANDTNKYTITMQMALPFLIEKKILKTAFIEFDLFIASLPLCTTLIAHYKIYNNIPSFSSIPYGFHLPLFPLH